MAKKHKKPKGGGASPGSKAPGSAGQLPWLFAGLAIAIAVLLAAGIVELPGSGSPHKSKRSSRSARGKKQPQGAPAVCPSDWPNCPRVRGADWVALEELQKTPSARVWRSTAQAFETCHGPHSLLSPQPVPGMHLLCVLPPPPAGTPGGASAVATVAVWRDMVRGSPTAVLLLPALSDPAHAIAALDRLVTLPKKRSQKYQPPALFTERGVRLQSGAALVPLAEGGARRLLCMEGGQWIWPPVEKGEPAPNVCRATLIMLVSADALLQVAGGVYVYIQTRGYTSYTTAACHTPVH